ncbi:MAG: SGNH/GDSL hydrolase family protein [Clostridia bacterium]|nr:SGNH/GDSL hydrolase family protein [Clostridia bacterium]
MENKSVLNGKTIVAIGDSLIHGNVLGNEATWVNKLAKKHDMKCYNYGINGNAIAKQDVEKQTPMCVRYKEMHDEADYVVVLGGANDRRLNIPIGEDNDTDIYTFKGAVNTLICGLAEKYPKAKLLFMTNYRRWDAPNQIGLGELDYVKAMEEVCRRHSIPCFNNYYNAGISFYIPAHRAWMDEGISLGGGMNAHFSDEAYTWLMDRYEKLLELL